MSPAEKTNFFSGPLPPGDLISCGWRLYRLHFRKLFIYSFFILCIFSSLFVIGKPFEAPLLVTLPGYFVKFPEMALLLLFILPTIFNFIFIAIFYRILKGESYNYAEIFKVFKRNITVIIRFCLLLAFEIVIFSGINLLIFTGIIFVFSTGLSALEGLYSTSAIFYDLIMVFSVLVIMVFLTAFIYVFFIELTFCLTQLVSIVIEDMPLKFALVRAFEIVAHKPSRFFWFVVMLISLCLAIYVNFHSLFFTIMTLIAYNPLIETTSKAYLVDFVLSLFDLFGFCIAMSFVWPFYISCLTLYFFDIKIRNEGMDLQLLLFAEKAAYETESRPPLETEPA